MKKQNLTGLIVGLLVVGQLTGCTPRVQNTGPIEANYTQSTPGVVQYVWEEPMVDVIDVPPGLDPEGHYYRPSHQEVVEIRQGRWQYYRDQAGAK